MWKKYKKKLTNLFLQFDDNGYRMVTGALFVIGIKEVIVYPHDNYMQFSGMVFFVVAYYRHTMGIKNP